MKKIVTMMIIILGVISVQARDPYHFIVQGSFIADKNIKYTIFN